MRSQAGGVDRSRFIFVIIKAGVLVEGCRSVIRETTHHSYGLFAIIRFDSSRILACAVASAALTASTAFTRNSRSASSPTRCVIRKPKAVGNELAFPSETSRWHEPKYRYPQRA